LIVAGDASVFVPGVLIARREIDGNVPIRCVAFEIPLKGSYSEPGAEIAESKPKLKNA
jgi:hypothetical protein